MKSFILLLCLVGVCGSDPVRRFRKVFHVPEDGAQDAVINSKNNEEAEDIFERLLHANWNSFSYNYHNHGHSFTHSHNHHHNHGHSNSQHNYYDDDQYHTSSPHNTDDHFTTNPQSTNGGKDDDDADFTQAGSDSGSSSPQPSDPAVFYPQDFTSAPSPAMIVYPQDTTESPASGLVTANEVGSATQPPSTLAPSRQTPDPTGYPSTNVSSCGLYKACSQFQGDCCPNSEGVYKACCFGVTYPPLIFPTSTDSPTGSFVTTNSVPAESPTNAQPTGAVITATPTTEPPTEKPSTPLVVPLINKRTENVLEKCGVSENERSQQLLQLLPAMEEGTPQYEAYQWMDTVDEGLLCGDEGSLSQRFTLAVTYFSLGGGSWKNCSAKGLNCSSAAPWLSGQSECDWFGVACDLTRSEITVLTLKENGLVGDLPTELFSLTKLTGLSLDHNKRISGSIPSALGQLSMLEYIELDDNAMTGPLPSALYDMTTLKALDLNGNQFNGTIDDNISSLSDLMVLQLEDNAFEGPIPWFGLAMLKDLLLLYVHGNDFDAGSLEPICNLLDSRRNEYPGYLQFMAADCDSVACSCCTQCF